MTGNPSGITNPISMTTTASTARSDMLAVSKFFDSGNTQKMPPKRIEPATEKTRLRGFEPWTSRTCSLLVNRHKPLDHCAMKICVESEKQTIYEVHKHVRPHGWQRSACRSGGAALQKGSTVQKSWTHRLPVAYIWKKTHKTMNKIFKIIYGNSTKLISKLTIDGMPKLAADCQDPETFLSWYLDYRGWTAIQGVTMYIIGPLPPRPGTDPANPDLRTSWDAKVAEGLRYLCAALADNDLKANVACNATRADGVANGPTGYMFLKKSMLQGTAEGPAIQQVLDGLRYKIDNSIVSFQSRFAKFANALHPRPAEDILCQKYIMAVTGETGAIFDAEVTTTIAMDDQTDFDRFAGKLTKLISQKSTRMTSQKPTPVGQSAQVAGNWSKVASDHDLLLQLQKQVNELTKELKTRQGKTQNGTPGAGGPNVTTSSRMGTYVGETTHAKIAGTRIHLVATTQTFVDRLNEKSKRSPRAPKRKTGMTQTKTRTKQMKRATMTRLYVHLILKANTRTAQKLWKLSILRAAPSWHLK